MKLMIDGHPTSIAVHFGHLTDPRVERTRAHNLLDILTITICAVLCGADGLTEMETFGKAKEAWVWTLLPVPNGIPLHDTFSQALAARQPGGYNGEDTSAQGGTRCQPCLLRNGSQFLSRRFSR
jgi:hypothetical protein